jgi:CRISPR-associated protein Cas1
MKVKTVRIALDSFGSFLGMEKGCFKVRDKEGREERYPLFESDFEVQIRSGNCLSSGVLTTLGFWQIDTLFLTRRGRPVAFLRSVEDDSHVSTRIAQYESLKNGKLPVIAKQFVLSKIEGENKLLTKYGLKRLDYSYVQRIKNLEESGKLRIMLTNIEGASSKFYFNQLFTLFYEFLRPEGRRGFKAYDGLNNLFNLGYEILTWRVHVALLKAKLEPYLGFVHSLAWSKPSLILDFMEIYRFLIDAFVLEYSKTLKPKDFVLKTEEIGNRKGKREYLNDVKTNDFRKRLNAYFLTKVKVPRYRMGNNQELETLINEEAMLFAKYLRNERTSWTPRIVDLSPVSFRESRGGYPFRGIVGV